MAGGDDRYVVLLCFHKTKDYSLGNNYLFIIINYRCLGPTGCRQLSDIENRNTHIDPSPLPFPRPLLLLPILFPFECHSRHIRAPLLLLVFSYSLGAGNNRLYCD